MKKSLTTTPKSYGRSVRKFSAKYVENYKRLTAFGKKLKLSDKQLYSLCSVVDGFCDLNTDILGHALKHGLDSRRFMMDIFNASEFK